MKQNKHNDHKVSSSLFSSVSPIEAKRASIAKGLKQLTEIINTFSQISKQCEEARNSIESQIYSQFTLTGKTWSASSFSTAQGIFLGAKNGLSQIKCILSSILSIRYSPEETRKALIEIAEIADEMHEVLTDSSSLITITSLANILRTDSSLFRETIQNLIQNLAEQDSRKTIPFTGRSFTI